MELREQIEQYVKEYVCPINHNPTTQYELGAVKTQVAFAVNLMSHFSLVQLDENQTVPPGLYNGFDFYREGFRRVKL